MKLFLASTAKHPDSIKKLKEFAGDLSSKHITYIPTAANGEFWGSWKTSESITVAKSISKSLEILELENYHKVDVASKLKQADLIWMAGGMPGYLLYWLRRLELNKLIPKLISKGVIYVGSSAGSMVCSQTQYTSELFLDDPEIGASIFPGLGLIDFEIYPHYREEQLEQIKFHWKAGRRLYLLKDGEAITVEDSNSVKVLGTERIIKL
ncbi:hypothetical protein COW99_04390 [Candidatus Roizmanbacteria bacterium CG22_combo_CG10-13_8_21_14_all_38_20]|uniref:Peptidase S51 n=1 Tax=Candidatus Roizmanbacteria bacterium CG22_combo_CG10-13_8_21_14_all_38_20 TaxID=1974862 RepID=A0A2H0BUS8_9BACT|nr:type 1 glutamine amidotransferase-like domain-containing protein [Candidatus Microgenomates bacterium]PIP61354.1 MAG: hypothetical protein COW99_04390 [Candidatus Roizmanbacteria bacterium CG22_combo_CG10-13_8_21_14_all_38_20]PJC31463.1 MAG: hypothetical protein CO050_02650 [Candidatus Roizmanbacteria bacterium CG_4_9_14_0_2_um_filter_38_17]